MKRELSQVETARRHLDTARGSLDERIRAARDAGATYRAIGEAAGLSHVEVWRRLHD